MYIPTFSKGVIDQLGPARRLFGWPRRSVPYRTESPWDFVRSAGSPSEPFEPRWQPEHVIEYPTVADQYESPVPEAWFENFHVPPTPQPVASPSLQLPSTLLDDPDHQAPAETDLFASDFPTSAPGGPMLEVTEAIQEVQAGAGPPAWLADQPLESQGDSGLEQQPQPPWAHEHIGGLECVVNEPRETTPPFDFLPPGLPI